MLRCSDKHGYHFSLRVGGGGGAEVSCRNIFSQRLPENQVVLSEYCSISAFSGPIFFWPLHKFGGGGRSPGFSAQPRCMSLFIKEVTSCFMSIMISA